MAFAIKKKDTVVVLTGKERGKRGEVLRVLPEKARLLVAKVNLVKKHQRPRRDRPGGIVEHEASLAVANVALVCPKCDQPTRPRRAFLEDGAKMRVCRKCGEQIL
jgi:large subunit ribosomal protein L24